MNDTAAAIGNATPSLLGDANSVITTAHLVWLLVFAALVVIALLYGIRRKRRRVRAERDVAAHAREAGVAGRPDGRPAEPAAAAPTQPAETGRLADEPVAATQAFEANPAIEAGSAPDAATGPADQPVTRLKGLGPKVATRLGELGIATVGQLAALDADGAAALDAQLGPFRGRLERDRWVEQARFLAAGDVKGFEAVFGRL